MMVSIPAVYAVTNPPEDTVARLLVALQPPPVMVAVSVVVALSQTALAPVILPALGNGLMVIVAVAVEVPQLLVTV
jgi:hypothetical protein